MGRRGGEEREKIHFRTRDAFQFELRVQCHVSMNNRSRCH